MIGHLGHCWHECKQYKQYVCHGLQPATARVSPSHVSGPLVSTEFGRMMEDDHQNNEHTIWDIMPSQDMTVCFMNHPLMNDDDAMIVSSRFADNGGFMTTSVCTYF